MSSSVLRARLGVPVIITALAALGTVSSAAVWEKPVLAEPHIPLALYVLVFALFEGVILHLQDRRDLSNAQTVTFSEIPLALGLLFLPPWQVALTGLAVPMVSNAWKRRQSLEKQAFNAANRLADVGVALVVYRALVPSDPFSIRGWLAICAAAASSGLLTSSAVMLVIAVATGRFPRGELREMFLSSGPLGAIMGTVGFFSGRALHGGNAAIPAFVCLALVLVGLRAFSRLTERHEDLVSFHQWGQNVGSPIDVEEVLAGVLSGTRSLLSANHAAAYVTGSSATSVSAGSDGRLLHPEGPGVPPGGRGVVREDGAVVSEAPAGDGRTIVVAASQREKALRPFSGDDARLLDMMVQQAGLALNNSYMIDRLRHDALHDTLTGLPNRTALTKALAVRFDEDAGTAVVWIGLQDFQLVNEALGYDLGDELLKQVAARLAAAAPPGALVARVDGDEFAALLSSDGTDSHLAQAQGMLSSLREVFYLSTIPVTVLAFAGLSASAEAGAIGLDVLLRHADIAMRVSRSKNTGVVRYEEVMDTATSARLAFVSELRDGIDRGELVLFAQPKIDLRTDRVVGVEALVRWKHPVRGMIPPGLFVPLAEHTGLDAPMTQWVLDRSLEAAAEWVAQGKDLTIAVNVPARALRDRTLVDTLSGSMLRAGVPGHRLVVEITESGLLDNSEIANEILTEIAALGVKISVDDFGTGYSSLSHLQRLPVNEIKVDQTFVSTMLTDSNNAAIVRSVIYLAQNLGMSCVAEGVEDQGTFEALRDLSCDTAQGYLMAKPMPVGEIAAWVDDWEARASAER